MQETQQENGLGIFLVVAALLVVGSYIAGAQWPHYFTPILQPLSQKLQQTATNLQGSGPVHTIFTIFINNSIAAIAFVLAGSVFGLYPVFGLVMNNLLLGVLSSQVALQTHVSLAKVLTIEVLPHGIIEIPALIWAAALGLNLGFVAARNTLRGIRQFFLSTEVNSVRGEQTFGGELKRAGQSLPWIIGMIFIAACIEGLVTPHLIQLAGLN